MRAEDFLLSAMCHRLLQDSARGHGIPFPELTPLMRSWVSHLVRLGLAQRKGDSLLATPRGRVVGQAEWEEAGGGAAVRIRAGSLWDPNLSKRWAAVDCGARPL